MKNHKEGGGEIKNLAQAWLKVFMIHLCYCYSMYAKFPEGPGFRKRNN